MFELWLPQKQPSTLDSGRGHALDRYEWSARLDKASLEAFPELICADGF